MPWEGRGVQARLTRSVFRRFASTQEKRTLGSPKKSQNAGEKKILVITYLSPPMEG